MSMIIFLKKAIKRLTRIIFLKKGIYGKIGSGNRFTKGVFVEEAAKIGMNNYFGPNCMINNAVIGNYCSIGPGVKIGQGVHSKNFITTYQPLSSKIIGHSLKTSPAILGSDVWCGANVVIMQGVQIGTGAIIGANAVVTKSIPPFSIAVGIPAKVIDYRFNQEEINLILESEWFLKNKTKAGEKIETLWNQINS